MIKKILISLALLVTMTTPLVATQPSYAINILNNQGSACNNASGAKPSFCADNSANASNPIYGANGILTAIINTLAKIVGVASVIIIVISGIRMIMSQDANASAQARRGVISAVVGLVIALVAQALVSFVLSKL